MNAQALNLSTSAENSQHWRLSAPRFWQPRIVAAARPHVLVAEDDGYMRRLLVSALERRGFEIDAVPDGLAALAYLRPWLYRRTTRSAPDLLLSDVRMPGWNGLEILSALRCAGIDVPTILITAFGAPETHAAARRLGAAAVVDKPLDLEQLCRLVKDTLDARR